MLLSCHEKKSKKENLLNQSVLKTVVIVPFGSDLPKNIISIVSEKIDKYVGNSKVLASAALPKSAFYFSRKRYRADSLLSFLKSKADKNEVLVGLTNKDISTTKGSYSDWGVMGLAFRPGNAAIISSYRLKNKTMFWKVVIHELGHTAGLNHCKVLTCFMRDADGGDPTIYENDFCKSCKSYLIKVGWNFNGGTL